MNKQIEVSVISGAVVPFPNSCLFAPLYFRHHNSQTGRNAKFSIIAKGDQRRCTQIPWRSRLISGCFFLQHRLRFDERRGKLRSIKESAGEEGAMHCFNCLFNSDFVTQALKGTCVELPLGGMASGSCHYPSWPFCTSALHILFQHCLLFRGF